jgi:lysophospholipase
MDAPFFADLADGPHDVRASFVTTLDGARVRVACWNSTAVNGTVVLLPGRTEYVEKYGRAAKDLAQRGFATLVIDWRGQGLADRALVDPMVGHIESFAQYQQDLDAMLAFASHQGMPEPYYLMAHSMGGCIGLRGLMRGIPVQAAAFSAPMWGILLSAWMRPFAQTIASASRVFGFDQRYAPGTGAKTYVVEADFAGNTLTTDPQMWAYMHDQAVAQPGLTLGGPSLGWLRAALSECSALAYMPSPDVPTLCALGTAEKIVDVAPIHNRMARWPRGKMQLFAGSEHEVMMEQPATRKQFFDQATTLFLQSR